MKMVCYPTFDGFAITSLANYTSYVQNARAVTHFKTSNGFETAQDCMEYLCKYSDCKLTDFVSVPY